MLLHREVTLKIWYFGGGPFFVYIFFILKVKKCYNKISKTASYHKHIPCNNIFSVIFLNNSI